MSAADIERCIKSIREKVVSITDSDPVFAAVVHEYNLTRREADMLRYLRHNAGNDEIATELFLSTETIKVHVRNLLKKLSIENRIDVAKWLDEYEKKM